MKRCTDDGHTYIHIPYIARIVIPFIMGLAHAHPNDSVLVICLWAWLCVRCMLSISGSDDNSNQCRDCDSTSYLSKLTSQKLAVVLT